MINSSQEAPQPIAIVGMGCMFPKARSLAEFWRAVRKGTDCISEIPPSHWRAEDYFHPDPKSPDMTYCRRGGFLSPVDFDPTEFGIPPTVLEATDTSQLLALVVAKAALEDAGYGEGREFDRERASVILGVTGLQELALPLGARLGHPHWRRALAEAGVAPAVAEDVVRRIADSYVDWQENSFPGLLGNVVAGRIANRLNLRGTNCVVDAACASSLSAIHLAAMELATGRCDMALAGGVDTLNDIFMYMCFSKTPALSPTGDARPFSESADGTVLGEGIGMVVLKRRADAERDGDRIYACIRAIGTSSDGRSQSIYAPYAAGQARCLRNAYALADVPPASVELIEAHGTGTKVGDAVEFDALRTVFEESGSRPRRTALGSVKSQIGHTKAAAGAAGLIKAALALYHRSLPPTIKVDSPNPKLGLDSSPFYLGTRLRPWLTDGGSPRRAGVSSFGFGGSNFHVVLEESAEGVREPAWDGSVQIVALSASTLGEVRAMAEDWQRWVAEPGFSDAELAWKAAASRRAFRYDDAHRLVIVFDGRADRARVLAEAITELGAHSGEPTHESPKVAFYGQGAPRGKLAFLFPGQGSQYVGMGRDLACMFPEMLDSLAAADAGRMEGEPAHRESIYPSEDFAKESAERYAALLTRTDVAQPALGAIAVGMGRVLKRFGVRPEMAAGHSYGELPALHFACSISQGDLCQLSRIRGRLMAAGDGDRGAMLAVKADSLRIEQLLTTHRLQVVIANRNAPAQSVLSGPQKEIARAREVLKRAGIAATPLNVAGAFHSSAMEPAAGPFRTALERVAWAEGAIPVYSNVAAAPYPADPPAARTLLASQITSPVDFVGCVQAMYDAGARTFVEVGPKMVLAGLTASILESQGVRILAVDSSSGRASGVSDLALVLAQLAAEGRPVDLSRWECPAAQPRKPKMVVPLAGANYRAPRPDRPGRPAKAAANAVEIPGASAIPSLPTRQSENPPVTQDFKMSMPHADRPVAEQSAAMHPQVMHPETTPSPLLAQTLQLVNDGLQAMQSLQQQTAAAHQRFLETQEQAHRTLQQVIEHHHRVLSAAMGLPQVATEPLAGPPPSVPAVSSAPPVPAAEPRTLAEPAIQRLPEPAAVVVRPIVAASPPASTVVAATPAAVATPAPAGDALSSVVLDVVCEKTGYPREMIELDMDIEADLGIDSIKRVEIIAAVEERIPSFAGIKPEQMGSIRTLREIVAFIGGATPARTVPIAVAESTRVATPASANASATVQGGAGSGVDFDTILVEVVSKLTGYPVEMIELDMDLEADLGIDSIKRVEILAAVEARVPSLPPIQPEYMGSLRTLRQIVQQFSGAESSSAPPPRDAAPDKPALPQRQSSPAPLDRRILRPIELDRVVPGELAIAADHEVWVVGEESGLAAALAHLLNRRGWSARLIDLRELQDLRAARPLGGLLIVAPVAAAGAWDERAEEFIKRSFVVTRQAAPDLLIAAESGSAVFASITRLDGAFGLLGGIQGPMHGGLAGLVKTAAREWPNVHCRALDLGPGWASMEEAARAILDELSTDGPLEVGLDPASRRGLELVPSAVEPGEWSIEPGDVVVVTGGARGVTAESVLALAEERQPTLVLLGRSAPPVDEPAWLAGLRGETEIKAALLEHEFPDARPTPGELQRACRRWLAQREIAGTLRRIASTGAAVHYRQVDVCDSGGLGEACDQVRRTLGPIRAIVHGAGVLEDRRILDKTPEQFDRVFETKVGGLRALLDAVAIEDLRQIVLFSSVSARFGNAGQADYAAANESLNKIAHWLAARLPDCRVRSINWGPWDGGMVDASLRRKFEAQGVGVIPLREGARAFVEEFRGGEDGVEIVIGSGFPAGATVRARRAAAPRSMEDARLAFERRVDPARHPFLRSHMLRNHPVLPLAISMEWLAHAALHAHPGARFAGLEDVQVLRGVVFDGGPLDLRLYSHAASTGSGPIHVPVELRSRIASGEDALNVRAQAMLSMTPRAVAEGELFPPITGLRAYPRAVAAAYDDVLFHGPHFRAIERIDGISSKGLSALLRGAPPPDAWMSDPLRSDWITDPLLMDGCFQLAILWTHEEMGALCLPSRVARYEQYAATAHGPVTAAMHVREHSLHRLISDFVLRDTEGAVFARLHGAEFTVDASLRAAFRPAAAMSISA